MQLFPNLTIESLSVFDVLGFCERQDYAELTEYLLNGIRDLAAAGAECAALTGTGFYHVRPDGVLAIPIGCIGP